MTQEAVAAFALLYRGKQCVGKPHVDTLVGRSAEIHLVTRAARGSHRETVGKNSSQREFQLGKFGKIVGEEQAETITPVSWARNLYPVEVLARLHQRETDPRVGAGDKLPKQFHV